VHRHGLFAADDTSREHEFLRYVERDEAAQGLGSREVRNESPFDFYERDARRRRDDANVRSERNVEAAAERDTLNGCIEAITCCARWKRPGEVVNLTCALCALRSSRANFDRWSCLPSSSVSCPLASLHGSY
jgi:hypothetical protein